jgi:hypothetical protein
MKPFGYWRDPLFLFCFGLYFLNRLVLKPYCPNTFSQSYLNDVICIPFWLPPMLFLMRKIGWRADDRPPGASEILIPLLVWSWVFESVAPYTDPFRGLAVGDPSDIFCYTVGAFAAAVFWRFWYADRTVLAESVHK